MKSMNEMLGKTLKKPDKKVPPHEFAATVDLIVEAGLTNAKYNYKYWLGKVCKAKIAYSEMIGILKEVQGMDSKYNKGGRLTNLLTAKAKKYKDEQDTKSRSNHDPS